MNHASAGGGVGREEGGRGGDRNTLTANIGSMSIIHIASGAYLVDLKSICSSQINAQ